MIRDDVSFFQAGRREIAAELKISMARVARILAKETKHK